jgi:hypothetical protein
VDIAGDLRADRGLGQREAVWRLSQNAGAVPKYRASRRTVSALTARGLSSQMIAPIRVAGTRKARARALADSPRGLNSSRSTWARIRAMVRPE